MGATLTADDGFRVYHTPWNTWAVQHASAGVGLLTNWYYIGFETNAINGYLIHRQFLGFDSTGLIGINVKKLTFRLYVTFNFLFTTNKVQVFKCNYARVNADYENFGSNQAVIGELTYATVLAGGVNRYYDIDLSDLTTVIQGGHTEIGLKGYYDNENINPSAGSNKNPPFTFQREIDANPPLLVVNFGENMGLILD